MLSDAKKWLMWVSEIQALAQSGLAYTHNGFDKDRYLRLSELGAEIAAEVSLNPPASIKALFAMQQKHYATPIVDIRSFVLRDDAILMVKERADGKWTLPGGFADVNESPSEAVARETLEESGFVVRPQKLLALWDKLKHDHPLAWPHIYKCVFHCELLSGEPQPNLEILAIDFFPITALPQVSSPRITVRQLNYLYELVHNPRATVFD